MNKQEFIKVYNDFLTEYNIDPNTVHASHGGSMLMLGLREETSDIDLTAEYHVYEKFLDMGFKPKPIPGWELIEVNDLVDIHPPREVTPKKDLTREGNVVYRTAERTLRDKKELGREKDKHDIMLLEEYLKNNKS